MKDRAALVSHWKRRSRNKYHCHFTLFASFNRELTKTQTVITSTAVKLFDVLNGKCLSVFDKTNEGYNKLLVSSKIIRVIQRSCFESVSENLTRCPWRNSFLVTFHSFSLWLYYEMELCHGSHPEHFTKFFYGHGLDHLREQLLLKESYNIQQFTIYWIMGNVQEKIILKNISC